jgi:drug/metabolite transporter (DMT)-like permease
VVSIGMWSAYTVLLRRKPDSIPPMAFLTVLMGLGALILLPLQLVERQIVGAIEPSLPNLLAVFYIALFPAVLALYFWNRAVAQLGANRVSPFVHLMPVFGTLMAMIFLGEQFNLHQAVGIAAILFGVYLASRRRVRPVDA